MATTAQLVYAHIFEETVMNRLVCDDYEEANRLARIVYGDTAIAVEINQWRVGMGDKYIGGIFYNVNPDTGALTEAKYIPTQEQQVDLLTAELEDAQLALVESHSENNQLTSEILTLQQAIVELYEKGGM